MPGDEKAALAALGEAERRTSEARTAALMKAPPELARLLASVAAAGAAHAYLLGSEEKGQGRRGGRGRMTKLVDAVQAVLAAEHATVYGYGVVGGRIEEAGRTRRGRLMTRTAPAGTR